MLYVRLILDGDRDPASVAAAYAEAYDEIQRRHRRAATQCTASQVSSMTAEFIDFAAMMSIEGLVIQRPAVLEHDLAVQETMVGEVREHYGPALDELRLLHAVAHESCEAFHLRHSATSPRHYALSRLAARGLLIADEIIHLLHGGYPSGALARWRSLHEVGVVAQVLADNDDETAQRYLDHATVGRATAARAHQEHAAALGETPLAPELLERILNDRKAAVAHYGPGFEKQFGWIAHLMPGADFSRLERAAGRDWLRPYYHLANHPIHAGAGNLLNELGVDADQVLLTGPSAEGLIDPIQLTAHGLFYLVRAMLHTGPAGAEDLEWIVRVEALNRLRARVLPSLPKSTQASREDSSSRTTHGAPDREHGPSLLAWPDVTWSDVEMSRRRPRR